MERQLLTKLVDRASYCSFRMPKNRIRFLASHLVREQSASLCDSAASGQNKSIKRSKSPSVPPLENRRRLRTAVLFLHKGEPRTHDEATQFGAEQCHQYYGLPLPVTTYLESLWYRTRGDRILTKLFSDAGRIGLPTIVEQHERLATALTSTLNGFLPELSPFGCYRAYSSEATEGPSIGDALDAIRRDAPEHVIVMSMYPFYWCKDSGSVINSFVAKLRRRSQVVDDGSATVRRVISGASDSFAVSPPIRWSLIDRWSTHPVLPDTFAQLIQSQLQALPQTFRKGTSILFCAPNRPSWDSNLSWFGGGSEGLLATARRLCDDGYPNMIVTPIAECARTLDSDVRVPALLTEANIRRTGAQLVRVVGVDACDATLVTGLAEVVRNHALTHADVFTANFAQRCRMCYSVRCRHSRRIFCDV